MGASARLLRAPRFALPARMTSRKAILAVLMVLALVAGSFVQGRLNHDRESLGLTRTAVISNAPPVLAFTTVALGGFRGLIANVLWIRTTELQEDGKYFEAVQLADWISKLQPHFSQVWINQAWNMAYNISVKFPNPEDRWLWVQRGIELLRDQGAIGLRREFGHNPHIGYRPTVIMAHHAVTERSYPLERFFFPLNRHAQAHQP